MLHASAASASADMKNECVVIKWRTFHQTDFVLANSLQILFDLFLSPFVAVDNDGHARRNATQIELLKLSNLNRTVREGIVSGRLDDNLTNAAELRNGDWRCRPEIPVLWGPLESNMCRFGVTIWDIQQDHRWIDEGVLGVELRRKRPDFIPKRRIANRDCAVGRDSPC